MRGFVVLMGMLIAATVAMLVWLDATGQLRPMLTTSPSVVIELAATEPDPAGDVDPAATDMPGDADGGDDMTDTGAADAASTDDADADVDAADADVSDTVATDTNAADTGEPDGQHDTDIPFGEGAVSIEDVPVATAGEAMDTLPADPDDAAVDGATADEVATDEVAADDAMADEAAADDATTDNAAAMEIDDSGGTPPEIPSGATVDATQTAALPIVSRDPNLPWQLNAAPFPSGDPRPRIAIVFTTLGLSDAATEAILREMPAEVTLAFSPYSRKLRDWIGQARATGHEVLIDLPMEPLNYPDEDPGPLALLSNRPMEDNVTRLDGILDRADGVVGVATQMGSRFSSTADLLRPILRKLAERGYLYVDNGTAPHSAVPALAQEIPVPLVINNQYLDTEASRIAIDGKLQQIERIARSTGAAVAFASPYPITIERLVAWIPTLEAKGFVLTPVTSIVGRQEIQ
jgi:polysaccharide deacetylase 2 family uncharacterized protein YibQ